MSRPLVYLSGPISGLTYEGGTGWREYAQQRLVDSFIDCLSPMRGKEFLKGAGLIIDQMQAVNGNIMSQDSAIVTRDRWDVGRCDFMLVNLIGASIVSIGTVIELGWADAFRKPVVLAMEPSGNIHEHAFIRQLSGYRVPTLDEALYVVARALTLGGQQC